MASYSRKQIRLNFLAPIELDAELRRLAALQETTLSALIRDALEGYCSVAALSHPPSETPDHD